MVVKAFKATFWEDKLVDDWKLRLSEYAVNNDVEYTQYVVSTVSSHTPGIPHLANKHIQAV